MLIIILLVFPILIMFIKNTGIEYILNQDSSDKGLININSAQYYLTSEFRIQGIAEILGNILSYSFFYLTLWLLMKNVWNKTYNQWPLHIQKFANAAIWIIVIASLFAFANNVATDVFYYRLLYFSVIPISVALSHILVMQYNTKHIRSIFYIASIWTIYRVLYAFYCSL